MSYGLETVAGRRRHAFETLFELMESGVVRTDLFPVRAFRLAAYREALRSLLEKGESNLVKAAFDFR